VSNPDPEDWLKLSRVLQYLHGTKHYELTFKPNNLLLTAQADAAFGVHTDMMDQGGCIYYFGDLDSHRAGPLLITSNKKTTTKSSFEAELVTLEDCRAQTAWFRYILEEINIPQNTTTICQDNKSTIFSAQKGSSSYKRTKHIHQRYFLIHNYIVTDEMRLEYLDTTSMVADILTKPLKGAPFHAHCSRLMGMESILLNFKQKDQTK
jgi:hypothetical protein